MLSRRISASIVILALFAGSTRWAHASTYTANCANPATNLQMVINGTTDGDTINVSGTCTGNFTVPDAITLQGWATLDGNQTGTTLTVAATSGTVYLTNLNIVNGSAGGGW